MNKAVIIEVKLDDLAMGLADYWDWEDIVEFVKLIEEKADSPRFTSLLKRAVNDMRDREDAF